MTFALEQSSVFLGVRDEGGRPYILIGGQAVYFRASRCAKAANELVVDWRQTLSEAEIIASPHPVALERREKRPPQWYAKMARDVVKT